MCIIVCCRAPEQQEGSVDCIPIVLVLLISIIITGGVDQGRVRCCMLPTSERWKQHPADDHTHNDEARLVEATGNSDAAGACSLDRGDLQPSEPVVYFDDLTAPLGGDGDRRYESSSFVVCEDNWDGLVREEQVDDSWTAEPLPFPADVPCSFGRKSAAASRFRVTDAGVITSLGTSSFGARRRKQTDDRRVWKSPVRCTDGNVAETPGSNASEAVSASKKSCNRQRSYGGDGCKRSKNSPLEDAVDAVDGRQKATSTRRRRQLTTPRKKSGGETVSSEASDRTTKVEGGSKRRTQSRGSRGPTVLNRKTTTSSTVCRLKLLATRVVGSRDNLGLF